MPKAIINATGRPVVLDSGDGFVTVPPNGFFVQDDAGVYGLSYIVYGEARTYNVPDPSPEVTYIVDSAIAEAYYDRDDFFVPTETFDCADGDVLVTKTVTASEYTKGE